MKSLRWLGCLVPVLLFAAPLEYPEFAALDARQASLASLVKEIRSLYRDDARFIAAFDTAQKKWDEYCAAMLEARFPAKDKLVEYGSVYRLAYAVVKTGLIEARIEELTLWVDGTEEGDVTAGSVKWKKELDEIRKRRKG